MTVKIEFSTGDADFSGNDLPTAVADVLRDLADRIDGQSREYLAGNGSRMRVADANGNTVGWCNFDIDAIDDEIAEDAVRDLDREQCVALLERVGIQSYDHEADCILRTAVQECLLSLDLSLEDVEAA